MDPGDEYHLVSEELKRREYKLVAYSVKGFVEVNQDQEARLVVVYGMLEYILDIPGNLADVSTREIGCLTLVENFV